ATEEKAENARLSSFVGALALGDLVKSTLGPKGMNKILQSASTGEINVTNDGATILKAIQLDNAAAKILVNISKVQDDEVGDGTTSVAVLAAELLREAEKLIAQKIHPQTIIEGYRIASAAALKALEKSAVDHSSDPQKFRQDLVNIARTTLSSKVLSQDKDYFANLAVDAVLRLKGSIDLEHIQIIKKVGGKLTDSYLDEGFILDKTIAVNSPKRMENCKILIANTSMDTDKVKVFGARFKVDGTGKLAELERAEREKMKAKVEAIASHGINVFVNRQLIYNYPESLLAEKGIMVIEHADFEGVERLSLVTGGEIASTFDHPELVKLGNCELIEEVMIGEDKLIKFSGEHADFEGVERLSLVTGGEIASTFDHPELVKLGNCELIEEVMIGEDKLIKFSGVAAGEACTVVLRGSTNQMVDEAERSLHDALSVLSQTVKETRTVLGGGCSEMLMSCAVEEAARGVKGKRAIATEAFGRALRQIPVILADNAGLDSSDLVARLRAAHYDGQADAGLDMDEGTITSNEEAARGVKGKRAIATEAFGRALRQIPVILADNAGLDSSDLVARLRAAHYDGQADTGLDMDEGTITSMRTLGVTESYKLKRHVVLSASEAAEMIIRVDDIIRATPRKREAV
ncbi:putative T-complex protein 1 subunit beta, partial [Leucoagaricus sp. SymC.cos]